MAKCLNNSYRWPMSKPILLFQALKRVRRTDWVLQPPSALFFSSCAVIAQTWTFLLYRGRIDVFVVIYLQNYYNLSSPGFMEPALLVNSQNICPGSDLMQCKSEQCHWCQLSCSRMELLWNQVLPVNYSRSITFIWSLVWGREILCWTE